jgi:hypothetical protein
MWNPGPQMTIALMPEALDVEPRGDSVMKLSKRCTGVVLALGLAVATAACGEADTQVEATDTGAAAVAPAVAVAPRHAGVSADATEQWASPSPYRGMSADAAETWGSGGPR